MEDKAIVDLYWQRSDRAIPETECKYGGYCHTVAMRIVNNPQDAEECVNDTWLGAWNSMPENRPSYLAPNAWWQVAIKARFVVVEHLF